jgi:NTP pyrophosphatase (non-canonical NTP hydrolase)
VKAEQMENSKKSGDFWEACKGLEVLAKEVHALAREKGWHEKEHTFGELIALCHSELSEALECYRTGASPKSWNMDFEKEGKPEGIPSELADVIIRVLDICGYYNINIGTMVYAKHKFNQTRPWRHGNKRI